MPEITELLRARQDAGDAPFAPLFEALYAELKRIAARRVGAMGPNQTLTATALVHEAYLKLVDVSGFALTDRKHFYACIAQAMRQILIDHARARLAGKRGGELERVTLSGIESGALDIDVLDLERALCELGEVDEELRQLVELRYFAGLTLEDIAALRGTSLRTANRDWQRARALLAIRLDDDEA
jgi:RNA polymerase sigma factor (TIGR02999 family)